MKSLMGESAYNFNQNRLLLPETKNSDEAGIKRLSKWLAF